MTDVIPEVAAQFTPEAHERLDAYLTRARAALAGCPEVSPDEIEQDIRAHVAAEFPPRSWPVNLADLDAVLARLGRPEQWVSDAEPPPWRRGISWVRNRPSALRRWFHGIVQTLRRGPEDWRLAYLTFGVLVVGVFLFPLLVVLGPVSYLLGRAAVGYARERGQGLGAQRWLIYPPLVIVSLPLMVGLFVWPAAPAGAAADDLWRAYRADIREVMDLPADFCEFLVFTYMISGALSLWGVILGTTFWSFPRLPAALFCPFFGSASRRSGGMIALISAGVLALWLSLTARYVPVADLSAEVQQRWSRDDRVEWRPVREDRRAPATVATEVPPQVIEQRVRTVTSQFLRSCRNRELDGAVRLTGLPFYKGTAAGTVLMPQGSAVVSLESEVRAFLSGQLGQTGRIDQMPNEVIGVQSYESYKVTAAPEVVADLDRVLTPTDAVVTVGRQGQESGKVLVRVRGGLVQVVGLVK